MAPVNAAGATTSIRIGAETPGERHGGGTREEPLLGTTALAWPAQHTGTPVQNLKDVCLARCGGDSGWGEGGGDREGGGGDRQGVTEVTRAFQASQEYAGSPHPEYDGDTHETNDTFALAVSDGSSHMQTQQLDSEWQMKQEVRSTRTEYLNTIARCVLILIVLTVRAKPNTHAHTHKHTRTRTHARLYFCVCVLCMFAGARICRCIYACDCFGCVYGSFSRPPSFTCSTRSIILVRCMCVRTCTRAYIKT